MPARKAPIIIDYAQPRRDAEPSSSPVAVLNHSSANSLVTLIVCLLLFLLDVVGLRFPAMRYVIAIVFVVGTCHAIAGVRSAARGDGRLAIAIAICAIQVSIVITWVVMFLIYVL